MKHLKSFQRSAIVFLCLGLLACAKPLPPRTAANLEEVKRLNSELAQFAQWREEIPSLSGFVQVKIEAGSRRELFDAALLAKPPNRLYLQILDDLGQERARVVADGRQVLFYEAQKNTYEILPQDAVALKKTLKLPLSVEELIARLLLQLPKEEVTTWEKAESGGTGEVAYWATRPHDLLGLATAPLRLVFYEARGPSDKWLYRVEYSMPEMRWSFHSPKIRLALDFKNVDIEKKLEDARFDTQPPEGSIPRRSR